MKEAKFTAAMVFNADKETIQGLRSAHNLGEKELMALIIQTALDHSETLKSRVANYQECLEASKRALIAEKESLKAKAKAERAEKRAEKKAQKEEALVAAKKGKKA